MSDKTPQPDTPPSSAVADSITARRIANMLGAYGENVTAAIEKALRAARSEERERFYDMLTVGRLALRGVPLAHAELAIVILRGDLEDAEREHEA